MSFRLLRNYLKNKKYFLLKNHQEIYFTIYPFLPNVPFFWIKSYFLKKNFQFLLPGKIFFMYIKPTIPFFLYYKDLILFDQNRLITNFSFTLFFIWFFFFKTFTNILHVF